MSALSNALQHTRTPDSQKAADGVRYVPTPGNGAGAPDYYGLEVPLLMASGVGRAALPAALARAVAAYDGEVDLLSTYLGGLTTAPQGWRKALTPIYVWCRSGIATYHDYGWYVREGLHGDLGVPAGGADLLNTSPVPDTDTLATLVWGGTGWCGADIQEDYLWATGNPDTTGNPQRYVAGAHPMRVAANGLLLLPTGYTPGMVLPAWPDERRYMPNPYHTGSPRPELVAAALIAEAQVCPPGYLVAALCRAVQGWAAECGADGASVALPHGDGDYALPDTLT